MVTRFIGAQVDFDAFAAQHVPERRARYRELFGSRHWRNTAFGVLFSLSPPMVALSVILAVGAGVSLAWALETSGWHSTEVRADGPSCGGTSGGVSGTAEQDRSD